MEASDVENFWPMLHSTSFQHPGPLLAALAQLVQHGAIYEVFDAVLDHSDLLIAYPDESERQVAEMWCALVQKIGADSGHEPAAILEQMKALQRLETKGRKRVQRLQAGLSKS